MSKSLAPLINLRELRIGFTSSKGTQEVIHGVDLVLGPQETLAIIGESGSGKSVMTRSLMGLLPPHADIQAKVFTVLQKKVNDYTQKNWQALRGKQIGMIFQEPMSALNPTMTCGQQVLEILLKHQSINTTEGKKRVIQLFKKVQLPQPAVTYDKYPHELSGGQMQRVVIAMAVACAPKILIADEPTTALDVTVRREIMLLIKSLQEEYGMSVILVSHDLGLVEEIADRVMVMYKGEVKEEGNTKQVFAQPEQEYTKALLAARPTNASRPLRLPTIEDFIAGLEEGPYESSIDRKERHQLLYEGTPYIKVRSITKSYPLKNKWWEGNKTFTAVNNVSFDLYPGESLGLVGESGCGKSTLGQLILALKPSTSGKVIVNGVDITSASKKQLRHLRKDIQLIFEDPFASLNPRLTVGQAIIEPMTIHQLYQNDKQRKEQALLLLEKVGLSPSHYNRYPHEFSGGQRQRIGIARTIAVQPRFIVCDESVSALDLSVQAQVLNLLNDLKDEFDFGYLFISHDLSVVRYFCDRIMVMKDGNIVETAEADQLYTDPQNEYTKQLIQDSDHSH